MRKTSTTKTFLLFCLLSVGIVTSWPARGQDRPVITSVSPENGVTTPGMSVMVFGTNLSPDSIIYFDGLEARQTKFINSTTLEVVTPYLRPGAAKLQLKSGTSTVLSPVAFMVSPSRVDHEIDRAMRLANEEKVLAAIDILTTVAKTDSDYQVRALAYYEIAQLYRSRGDLWRAAGVPIFS